MGRGAPKTTQMVHISPAGPALGSQRLPAGLGPAAGERPGVSREAKASAGDRWPATQQSVTSGSQLKEGETGFFHQAVLTTSS